MDTAVVFVTACDRFLDAVFAEAGEPAANELESRFDAAREAKVAFLNDTTKAEPVTARMRARTGVVAVALDDLTERRGEEADVVVALSGAVDRVLGCFDKPIEGS